MFFDQGKFDVRCEWGLPGVRLIGGSAGVPVIVDVLSFSTCVDVAVSRGARIFPCRWKGARAGELAAQFDAELAVPRGQAGKFSLSPASMKEAVEGRRIVLPSPNGSELTVEAGALERVVLAGCFRNCEAVGKYAAARGGSVAVIAAGERWPDRTLRPAVEDLAAAGAIIASLSGDRSPEASAAIAVWNYARNGTSAFLKSCSSGRELIEWGFEEDVIIASEVNVSSAVPRLHEQAYIRAGGT